MQKNKTFVRPQGVSQQKFDFTGGFFLVYKINAICKLK